MSDTREGFVPNPILEGLIGLCPIIVVSGNFASGTIVALGIFLSMICLGAVLPALRGLFAERLRAPLAFALAAVLAAAWSLAAEAWSPALASLTGIFIPLTLVNCLVLATMRRGVRNEDSYTAWVLPAAAIYFLTVVVISAFREGLGAGRLTLPLPGPGITSVIFFESPPLRLLTAPTGGFLLLGLLAALYRSIQRKLGRRIP